MTHVTFWTYFEGRWQGIRLAPGESVELYESGKTDEGWSSSGEVFALSDDGQHVTCDAFTDGRDCDGRMSTEWHGVCPVSKLEAMPADKHGPARPEWTELRRGQRDYTAEAAGY